VKLIHERMYKCPHCRKYVFLKVDDSMPFHYKNVVKNLVCTGSHKKAVED